MTTTGKSHASNPNGPKSPTGINQPYLLCLTNKADRQPIRTNLPSAFEPAAGNFAAYHVPPSAIRKQLKEAAKRRYINHCGTKKVVCQFAPGPVVRALPLRNVLMDV
jgi:hypothetical protein